MAIYNYALAAGITCGFLAVAGIALAALMTADVAIEVRRALGRRGTAARASRPAPGLTLEQAHS